MGLRRLITRVALLALLLAATGAVHLGTARALILIPSLEVVPASGEVGTVFTFDVAWPAPPPYPVGHGCNLPVDYAVYGPGDPNGDWGPQIASGTLAANTYAADGTVLTYGTATVTPTQPGTYTINPLGPCDAGSIGPRPASFDVTPSTRPPDTLTVTPLSQSQSIDNPATVTATLQDGVTGDPVGGTALTFSIDGPNHSLAGSCVPAGCVTDGNGQVVWTYAGTATGNDSISVWVGPEGGAGPLELASVDWTPTVNGARFAALGDSYSAGEGNGSYLDGTDWPTVNMCHRSLFAYGELLDTDYDLGTLGFAACSGAVTDDLFAPDHASNREADGTVEPAQLCLAAASGGIAACSGRLPVVGPDTKVVTLTIGGNDVGFVPVVSSCVWASISRFLHLLPGSRGCRWNPAVVVPAIQRLAALAGLGTRSSPDNTPIHSLLSTLQAIHAAAPNARVYIAGYPQLFQDTTRRDCTVGSVTVPGVATYDLRIAPFDAAWLDSEATILNRLIARAAARAGSWATYVDVAGRFRDHGICSGDPWLYPVVGELTGFHPSDFHHNSGALHPTVEGQTQGYEQAFVAAGING